MKHPGLNFSSKVFIERPGLFQVLRASVHKNQGNDIFFEKVSIKRPELSQFQILEASKNQVL
jgi:hypothetical protein